MKVLLVATFIGRIVAPNDERKGAKRRRLDERKETVSAHGPSRMAQRKSCTRRDPAHRVRARGAIRCGRRPETRPVRDLPACRPGRVVGSNTCSGCGFKIVNKVIALALRCAKVTSCKCCGKISAFSGRAKRPCCDVTTPSPPSIIIDTSSTRVSPVLFYCTS